jgi:G2/mitotic-specific cyclin 3/4
MMAQNNAGRRAFGDVSNIKDKVRGSRDDSGVGGKSMATEVKGPGLSQPAQRPMSLASSKSAIDNVSTTKPINPAGKAQPVHKSKRTNAVYKDQLRTVPEKDTSKEPRTDTEIKSIQQGADKPHHSTVVESKVLSGALVNIIESDATVSETEELKDNTQAEEPVSAMSEPEEWDGDETKYHVAPSCQADGTTAHIFPRMSNVTFREMIQARAIVESQQTEEDIQEDLLDTTMVAEYGPEIFLHLRRREVCSAILIPHYQLS